MFSNFKVKEEANICSRDSQRNGHDCYTLQPKGKIACPKCKQKEKGVLGKTLEHLRDFSLSLKLHKILMDCLKS